MSNTINEPEGKQIMRVRRIPTKGEVFVKVGDEVEPDTVLVRGMVKNPDVHEIKIYAKLGIDTDQVKQYMLKGEGDEVKKNEAIAIYRAFFGRFTKVCRSPIDGTIEALFEHGVAIIRGLPIPVEADAHIPGRVVEVILGEGAVVETRGVVMNGVFGVGGEERGELVVAVDEPGEALTAEAISDGHNGKILVGGALVTLGALRKAADAGVKGIITGGIDQKDLTKFLGYEIGVGVTGNEDTGLTIIVTEGFGTYPMDDDKFRLLKSHEGRQASIDGSTQIRQRMLRPEIIIPT